MVIFIVSFVVFVVLMSGMAIGVIAGRAPISGSCGGVGKILGTPKNAKFVATTQHDVNRSRRALALISRREPVCIDLIPANKSIH